MTSISRTKDLLYPIPHRHGIRWTSLWYPSIPNKWNTNGRCYCNKGPVMSLNCEQIDFRKNTYDPINYYDCLIRNWNSFGKQLRFCIQRWARMTCHSAISIVILLMSRHLSRQRFTVVEHALYLGVISVVRAYLSMGLCSFGDITLSRPIVANLWKGMAVDPSCKTTSNRNTLQTFYSPVFCREKKSS